MPMVTVSKVCVALAGLLVAVSAIPVPNRIPVEFCQEDCCKFGFVCCFDTCVLDRPGNTMLCPGKESRCCEDPDNDCAAQIPPSGNDCKDDCCPTGLDCICGTCEFFNGLPVPCLGGPVSCCDDPENPCATDVNT